MYLDELLIRENIYFATNFVKLAVLKQKLWHFFIMAAILTANLTAILDSAIYTHLRLFLCIQLNCLYMKTCNLQLISYSYQPLKPKIMALLLNNGGHIKNGRHCYNNDNYTAQKLFYANGLHLYQI